MKQKRIKTAENLFFKGSCTNFNFMKTPVVFFLADDDEDDREIFVDVLNQIDHSIVCITANDGEAALEKLKNNSLKPDYIFLDVNMPRVGGRQCLNEIKRIDALKDIPVYMYSTTISDKIIAETKSMNLVSFITKPTSMRELHTILTRILAAG
jgi:CheY-like chemotaxis protein